MQNKENNFKQVGEIRVNLDDIMFYCAARLTDSIVFRSCRNDVFEVEFKTATERDKALIELDTFLGI